MIPSGNPNGLKTITAPGWSGKCYVVPRQSVKELKHQSGNDLPGLYILFGQDEVSGVKLAYVGESENFYSRITSHDALKDFWDTAVIFTGGLNRAFVKYLEHRATVLASEVKRMNMQNKVQPAENSLSDFDIVGVDQYFETMQFILSAMNYEVFEKLQQSFVGGEQYFLKLRNVDARARLLDNGGMLVLAGSQASIAESDSYTGWTKEERKKFVVDGRFVVYDGGTYILTADILFKSPSAAAATMAARSINGWTAWRDADSHTLDQNLRR